MRNAHGYATIVDPDRPLTERDTASCCHCGAVIFTKPGTASTVYLVWDEPTRRWLEEPGASCYRCYKPVCLRCHDHGRCTPLEKWMEQQEARARFRASV